MTAPRFLACRCGHPKSDHEALAPQCAAGYCTCLRYLPAGAPAEASRAPVARVPAPAQRTTVVESSGPTIEQLLTAAKRSSSKRISALAKKVETLAGDLRTRLVEERTRLVEEDRLARRKAAATEEARREIVELETKLAAARAKLRPTRRTPPAAASPAAGQKTCPEPGCGATSSTGAGVSAHRRFAHGYRAGEAS